MARVAFVLAEDFEDSEFTHPYDAVRDAGHDAVVIGTEQGQKLTGKRGDATVATDTTTDHVTVDEFDALVRRLLARQAATRRRRGAFHP